MLGRETQLTRIFDVAETDADASTPFVSKRVRQLYDWWAGANGGQMPPKRMFDVIDHRSIVANLFLTEVTPNGDFVFKLLGEEVIQIIGRNRTGETVPRVATGEYGHELYEYYRSVAAGRVCRKCTGSLVFATRGFRRFESIDCPLAADEGDKVAMIIGVMDLIR